MAEAMFAHLTEEECVAGESSTADEAPVDDWRPIRTVPADTASPMFKHPTLGDPVDVWEYRDAKSRLLGYVCRYAGPSEGKEFRPLTYCEGPGGVRMWRYKSFPAPRPLYGLDRLAQRLNAPVLVCEGEKAADAATKRFPDHVCIATLGGAQAASKADLAPLLNRNVIGWPDNDHEGVQFITSIAELCVAGSVASVKIVSVPDAFPLKWDLADPLPIGWNEQRLRGLLEEAKPYQPNMDEAVSRLATLSKLEYDRQRKTVAKLHGVRVTILDDAVEERRPRNDNSKSGPGKRLELPEPEPWPEPVDGAELLDHLVAEFQRYLAMPDGAAEAMALWVLHTHTFDAAQVSPRLALTSPEKRCGKTTALTVLGRLVPRPLPAANVTAAAVFRTIEAASPTLLLDEADTFLRKSDELRGVLNSGHHRATAYVVRTVGDDHEPRQFRTWAPVAIASIGRLPPTLEDRSIEITMRRRLPADVVERLRLDRLSELDVMARQAARWARDNSNSLVTADPAIPDELGDRAADNWRCLLAIADVVGSDWPKLARAVAVKMSMVESGEDGSYGVQLLGDIKAIFENRSVERLSSSELCATLIAMEDRPWPELKKGKPITPRQLAKLLQPFGIAPGSIRTASGSPKGYKLEAFTDAFARYLPNQSATPPQAAVNHDIEAHLNRNTSGGVADTKSQKMADTLGCSDVADQEFQSISSEEWSEDL